MFNAKYIKNHCLKYSTPRCNYYTTSNSYWMATVDEDQQFKKPVPQTLKAGNLRSRWVGFNSTVIF